MGSPTPAPRLGWSWLPAVAGVAVLALALSSCAPAVSTSAAPAADPDRSRRAALMSELTALKNADAVGDRSMDDLVARKADLERRLADLTGKDPRLVEAKVVRNVTHQVVVPISTFQHCYDFRYQQDAQAVYQADLRDPYGLDGAPGPYNDDGLACTTLPADPGRPASIPAGAHVEPKPVTPSRDDLLSPDRVRFGLYTEQAPFNYSESDLVARAVGKKPDTIGFFLGWDQGFRPDAVTKAWRQGMLPLLTWESLPNLPLAVRTTADEDYEMSRILGGEFDDYIDQFALDVKDLGLPLIIRLNQEMNADYYPWSDTQKYNKRGEYVALWRYVVDRFRAIGADRHVIWLWTPNRVDDIPQKQIGSFYPGDDYVDWVGVDGYWRNKSKTCSFAVTYARTLGLLRALTRKPIFIGEVGATESADKKVLWLNSFFESLPRNPDIIGFAWFSLTVAGGVGEATSSNDWRINSSKASVAAFRAGIADPRYGMNP